MQNGLLKHSQFGNNNRNICIIVVCQTHKFTLLIIKAKKMWLKSWMFIGEDVFQLSLRHMIKEDKTQKTRGCVKVLQTIPGKAKTKCELGCEF